MTNETLRRILGEKKPFYKRWWFWVLVVIFIGISASSGDNETEFYHTAYLGDVEEEVHATYTITEPITMATLPPAETEPIETTAPTTEPAPLELAQLALAEVPDLELVAAQVTRIIDGDTIEVIYNGVTERVRFIGIDAPERGETGFAEATDFVREEITNVGDVVFLQASGNNRDRFDRLRRYIWLGLPTDLDNDEQRSELLLNQMLLDEELAVEMIIGGETAPTQPPATQAPTVAPTLPPATQAPTVAPTQPPATQAPTVAPTQPPATQAPTVAPTEPPFEETPATVISIQAPNQARRGERINITLSGAGSQGIFTLHMRTPSGGGSNAGDFNNGNKTLQANQNGSATFEFMIGTNSTIGGVFTLTVNGATHTITVAE